jgi:hypothetical protein
MSSNELKRLRTASNESLEFFNEQASERERRKLARMMAALVRMGVMDVCVWCVRVMCV